MEIREIIRKYRIEQGISLAKLSTTVGCSKQGLLNWEQKRRNISFNQAEKILNVLGYRIEIVKKETEQIEKMQLSKEDATKDATLQQDMSGNMSGTHKSLDCISRQAVISEMKDMYTAAEEWAQGAHDDDTRARAESCMATNVELKLRIEKLPSVQPDLSDAYMKAVYTWLLDYQIKAAELKGRYTPYEVLSWVVNDWRKEHE